MQSSSGGSRRLLHPPPKAGVRAQASQAQTPSRRPRSSPPCQGCRPELCRPACCRGGWWSPSFHMMPATHSPPVCREDQTRLTSCRYSGLRRTCSSAVPVCFFFPSTCTSLRSLSLSCCTPG
ncbi:hypothetical protein PVAP13_5NG608147 [Panicum virgatum]|uniref:Uncharacterized protein n=1 Tax=Panicum virgatum TaxID=38727 RepID=A0A8T0S4P1_PANVG|nr:hypothetical protein PVAP13_5NG608147 [Panicum virgatum]